MNGIRNGIRQPKHNHKALIYKWLLWHCSMLKKCYNARTT